MQDTKVMERVSDGRALLGGLALLMAGIILSIMTYLYFTERFTGANILKARWWWEIILNLQILCIAFMWFCYAERIKDPDRAKSRQMKVRMFVSLFAVLVPTWIMVLSAAMGWLVTLPPKYIIDIMFGTMLAYWIIVSILPRAMVMQQEERKPGVHLLFRRYRKSWHVMPFIIAFIIGIVDIIRGTEYYYLAIPFLFYTQAAMPYFLSGFGIVKPPRQQ